MFCVPVMPVCLSSASDFLLSAVRLLLYVAGALQRAGRTHYMYSTLAPLLDNKGFNNMLSIIVYEAPNAAKEDLILVRVCWL